MFIKEFRVFSHGTASLNSLVSFVTISICFLFQVLQVQKMFSLRVAFFLNTYTKINFNKDCIFTQTLFIASWKFIQLGYCKLTTYRFKTSKLSFESFYLPQQSTNFNQLINKKCFWNSYDGKRSTCVERYGTTFSTAVFMRCPIMTGSVGDCFATKL